MKHHNFVLTLAFALAATSWAAAPAQQTRPTATRVLQLSAFGAVSGVYTGLSSGKNLSVTAGGDLGLPPWRGMRPTIEVRGTYPIDDGTLDSQRSVLGGIRVDFLLNHRLRPYGDFLFGRGQINYGSGFPPFDGSIYALTTTYIDSPGAGFNYDLNEHWGIKVDGQFQRWAGPDQPTQSGNIYSKVGTAGIVYTFTFDRRHRR